MARLFRLAFAEACWIDAARMRTYANLLLSITVLTLLAGLVTAHNGLDALGKPLGTDFVSFWSASRLALAGTPAAVYDPALHRLAEIATVGGDSGYAAFFYPPPYLLICLPLALLPYFPALVVWLGLTATLAYAATRTMIPAAAGLVARLAFPAVFLTIGHGQNAFLALALLAAGCRLWDRRPGLAGVLFGLLVFKPQLAMLLPVILALAGRWRTLGCAAASALAVSIVALAVFGRPTWEAYLHVVPLARLAMEDNMIGNEKMVSLFAAARLLGGSLSLAYAAQAIAVAAIAALLGRQLRRPDRPAGIDVAYAGLAAAGASPFLLDYDLMVLALPLGWLLGQGLDTGFRPFEKLTLLFAYALPGIARPLAGHFGTPLAPLVIAALFVAVAARARGPRH